MTFGGPLVPFQISLTSELFIATIDLARPHAGLRLLFGLCGSPFLASFLLLFILQIQPQ
jgi:hypothetical protein